MKKLKKVIVRIRDKNEITLPKEIRDKLGWGTNDYLIAVHNKEENAVLLRKIEL